MPRSLARLPSFLSERRRRCRCATSAGFSPLGPSFAFAFPPPFDSSAVRSIVHSPLPSSRSLASLVPPPRATLGWHNRGRDQGGQIESGGGREERRIRAEGGGHGQAAKRARSEQGAERRRRLTNRISFRLASPSVHPSILLQGHPYMTSAETGEGDTTDYQRKGCCRGVGPNTEILTTAVICGRPDLRPICRLPFFINFFLSFVCLSKQQHLTSAAPTGWRVAWSRGACPRTSSPATSR